MKHFAISRLYAQAQAYHLIIEDDGCDGGEPAEVTYKTWTPPSKSERIHHDVHGPLPGPSQRLQTPELRPTGLNSWIYRKNVYPEYILGLAGLQAMLCSFWQD